MSKELELAKYYFDLSNTSSFTEIATLFDEKSTFCTRNLDYFIGVKNIMPMQKAHHSSYQKLHWEVTTVEEVKPGVIRFDFDFSGLNKANELIQFSGIEYVVIRDGIIRHIDIRSA